VAKRLLIYLALVFFVLWFFRMRQKRPDGREDIRGRLRALAGMIGIFAGIFIALTTDMRRRRDFLFVLGAAGAWPLAARAQPSTVAVVGLLSATTLDQREAEHFRQGLAEAGYLEDRDVAIDIARRTAATTGCRRLPPIWCAEADETGVDEAPTFYRR
jgi:hypothetical protein